MPKLSELLPAAAQACQDGDAAGFEAILKDIQAASGSEFAKGVEPLWTHLVGGPLEAFIPRFIAMGASPDLLSAAGSREISPLGFAIFRERHLAVETLLRAGADPNGKSGSFSHVTLAMSSPNSRVLSLLLAWGADPNELHGPQTPLSHAAERDDAESVAVLLAAGADPHKPGLDGRTVMALTGARCSPILAAFIEAKALSDAISTTPGRPLPPSSL